MSIVEKIGIRAAGVLENPKPTRTLLGVFGDLLTTSLFPKELV